MDFLKRMPEDSLLIFKHHPFVKADFDVSRSWEERLIIPEEEESLNELLLISDLLITDYSSCIFEAALLSLPMIFYAFDEEEYTRDRDFYFNYSRFVPGMVTHDFAQMTELAADILSGRTVPDQKRIERFRGDYLDALDGGSTDRIAEYLHGMLNDSERPK